MKISKSNSRIYGDELYRSLGVAANQRRPIGHVTVKCLTHCEWWPRWKVSFAFALHWLCFKHEIYC